MNPLLFSHPPEYTREPSEPGSLRATVAEHVRFCRLALHLSQPELAQLLKVSRNTMIEWEKPDGRSVPTWEQLEQLGKLYQVPAAWFYGPPVVSDTMSIARALQTLPKPIYDGVRELVNFYKTKG